MLPYSSSAHIFSTTSPCFLHCLHSITISDLRMTRVRFLILILCIVFVVDGSSATRKMVGYYELQKGDFSVKITDWGATVMSVVLPDSKGNLDDVALGYSSLGPYINDTTNFGRIVGRVANRISGARFVLNGKAHRLYANDGNNSLHGGHRGFGQVLWSLKAKVDGEFPSVTLYYHSFDGEQGFPGDLDVYVTYKISGAYEFTVIMEAKALNKATPVNLAQHTYWNLGGHNSGNILGDEVQIFASHITPVDDSLIPTGEISSVSGTPYDFTKPETIGSRIEQVKGGYDINYVIDSPVDSEGKRKAAVVHCSRSGRKFELWTNQPGVQFYTANYLKDVKGKLGTVYQQHDALCLETQGFPDSVNHPDFPSQIVNPGESYKHLMLFKFSTA